MMSVGGAALVAWLLPNRPSSHRGATRPALRQVFMPMLHHLRNPRLLTTYLVGFNVLFSLVGVFTYITFYLAAPPFSLSTAKLSLLFVVYLVGLVATPLAGALLPRVGLRTGITGSILLSLVGVLLTLVHSLPVVITGLALCCTGVFISQSCATSFLREAASESSRLRCGNVRRLLLHRRDGRRSRAQSGVEVRRMDSMRRHDRCDRCHFHSDRTTRLE
jgi:predicted MFS family arabinose efflux permease